jgi:FkbM family methyltransferase
MLTELRVFGSRQLKRVPPVFDAVRKCARLMGNQTAVYRALKALCAESPNVTFIQIGANDGISLDPLREFIVESPNWQGVFVEPVPQIFEKLRCNYRYLRGRDLQFENVAISGENGRKQFWKIKDEYLSSFPPFGYQIGSFDREHIIKHFPHMKDISAMIESISVPCITYEQLRKNAGLHRVDVLHLDVEGHEHEILKSIDFEACRPKLIIFEISHMTQQIRGQVCTSLRSNGYQLEEADADCMATQILRH